MNHQNKSDRRCRRKFRRPFVVGTLATQDMTASYLDAAQVDLVAAEDTCRTAKLLAHLQIKPTVSYYHHNDQDVPI